MYFHHIGKYINNPKCSLKDKIKFKEFDDIIDNYLKMKYIKELNN